jgi:hypothetical protein
VSIQQQEPLLAQYVSQDISVQSNHKPELNALSELIHLLLSRRAAQYVQKALNVWLLVVYTEQHHNYAPQVNTQQQGRQVVRAVLQEPIAIGLVILKFVVPVNTQTLLDNA